MEMLERARRIEAGAQIETVAEGIRTGAKGVEVVIRIINPGTDLVCSVAEFAQDPCAPNLAGVIPGVPGGAGAVARNAGKCADAMRAVDKCGDAAKAADKCADATKATGKCAKAVNALRRPSLSAATRRTIEAAAEKTTDGKFIDPNTREVIEGAFDCGHKPGYEHRRLLTIASEKGMTQDEFNKWVNSHPEWFQIEKRCNNRSQ